MLKANNPDAPSLGGVGSLKRLVYFAAVVETGSFTAAADRLGITKAVVSQQVAKLEQAFRTSLLVRTTRKVRPTEAGLAFYERCAAILRDAEAAFDELDDRASEPAGLLRLTAPFDYGIAVIVPAIAAFTQRYPACKVEAILSDQSLDMMSDGIELAIRVGWLAESNLQARTIGSFRQVLVGPSRLRTELARLDHPEQMAPLPFIANTVLREPLRWNFTGPAGARHSVQLQANIFLDATLGVREAVRAGAGLSVLPDYAVNEDLASGRLVEVLPQWTLPEGGIHAVFPTARFRPLKVRAFTDLLQEREQARLAGA
ncbi:MAG: LysR family transcriptional regulator [Massilia sp.]